MLRNSVSGVRRALSHSGSLRMVSSFSSGPPSTGPITLDDLQKHADSGRVDTVIVGFTDMYGRFMSKRVHTDFFFKDVAPNGTHTCNYLLGCDMKMDPVDGYQFSSWQGGYGDFHLVPDMSTLVIPSWLDQTALVICDVHDPKTHDLLPIAPRSMLKKALIAAEADGYHALAATELEYYLYTDTFDQAFKKDYKDLNFISNHNEDYHTLQSTREEVFNGPARRHLHHTGIPVENSKGESGRGQHELNVEYAEILKMADRHCLYKMCLKDVAHQTGHAVSFMAKPHQDQAGNGCHIHLSLWKGDENAFVGRGELGSIANCSDEFRHFLGGYLKHTSKFMPFFAPNVNSYKRFQSASWAPTRLAWSQDNRTAGFRIVGSGKSLRIELRIPGADVNPYLAFTAALSSGMDGVRNKTEPCEEFQGDIYSAKDLEEVPTTLRSAIDAFSSSEFVSQSLGEPVQQHYANFFEKEQAAFDASVTDWETRRYFEQI